MTDFSVMMALWKSVLSTTWPLVTCGHGAQEVWLKYIPAVLKYIPAVEDNALFLLIYIFILNVC
jgi:hypothetical protein